MKKRLTFFGAATLIAASAIIGGALGGSFDSRALSSSKELSIGDESSQDLVVWRLPRRSDERTREIEETYRNSMQVVAENYAGSVNYEQVNNSTIQGMLSALDPHSSFFSHAEFAKLKEEQQSRFVGIGVTILRHRDGVYVQSPVEGTPAARAGLRYGDRIVEVDGKDAREWSSAEVSKNVRGVLGTPVNLKVERAGSPVPLHFTIVRDAVPLPSVRTAYMVRPGTGYIAITSFTQTTSKELRSAIESLQKQGMRNLVLDLRNNPGGLLQEAVGVAGQFLPRGATIVSVRGRTEAERIHKNYESTTSDMPLVVLINRNSASASEIVSGAIQDYGRGLVVGETSFGKGLVQRVFNLPFGNGLTLTTQKYYTPYGRLIQREYTGGSLYDYYVRHNLDDASELKKEAREGTSPRESAPQPQTPPAPTQPVAPNLVGAMPDMRPTPTPTPPPTGPAVATAGGRVFYGGGGITPDISAKPMNVATKERGQIFEAAFYFTRELTAGKIPGLENYHINTPHTGEATPTTNRFPVNDRVLEAFRRYVARDASFELTSEQIETEIDYVRLRIAEEIATAVYGSDAAVRVLLEADPQLMRALQALPDARRLAESTKGLINIG